MQTTDPQESRVESIAGALTLALHAAVLGALLSYEPARSALQTAAPIMVSLLQAETTHTPPVEIPPKPKPVVRPRPPDPAQIIAAPTPAPAAMTAPPLPEPPPAAIPEPVAVAAPVAALPEPVTPPIFNADYLDNPPPPYPAAARRSGQQGRVVLRVLVNPSGTAGEVQVRESSGHLRLDEAARDTVQHWRFVPAKRGAQPVPAWVLIPISFRLES